MTPIRPIMGDGVILEEKHFAEYATAIRQFWEEVIAALLPVMCPRPLTVSASNAAESNSPQP